MPFGSYRLRPATMLAPAGVALVLHAFLRLPLLWVSRTSPTFTHPWHQSLVGIASDLFVTFAVGAVAVLVALFARPLQKVPAALFRAPFVAAFGVMALALGVNLVKVGAMGAPLAPEDLSTWQELAASADAFRAWVLDAGRLALLVPCALLWFVFVSAFSKTLKDACEAAIGVRSWRVWLLLFVVAGVAYGAHAFVERFAVDAHEPAEHHPVPYVWARLEEARQRRISRPQKGIESLEAHLSRLGAMPLKDEGYPTRNRRPAPAVTPEHPYLGPRTNVVVLVLEGAGMAPLAANPQLAPFLSGLEASAVVLERHATTAFRDGAAQFSLLCGMLDPLGFDVQPDFPRQPLRCLPRILSERGYSTHAITGGPAEVAQTREFLRTQGVEELVTGEDFPIDVDRTSYGAHDGPMLDRLLSVLDRASSPSFTFALTTSNRPPFEVPEQFVEEVPQASELEGYRRSYRYMDAQLQRFFEAAKTRPWFQDTLFVIVGDHAPTGWEEGDPRTGRDLEALRLRYRTVAMLVHPKLAPARISVDSSHIDLPPTILALLGLDAVTDFAGRDLFASAAPPYVASQDTSRRFFYALHGPDRALVRGLLTNTCDVLEAASPAARRACTPGEWAETRSFESTFLEPVEWEIVEAARRQASFASTY